MKMSATDDSAMYDVRKTEYDLKMLEKTKP